MAILHNLKIRNFRGVSEFNQNLSKGLTCIIGRGDSGKSTILDAISLVLSPSWSINFFDSDFYNSNTEIPIEIEATLSNLPDKLLTKFGLYVRGISDEGEDIIDDMESEAGRNSNPALTIRLTVTKYLEPIWTVVTNRHQEPISISASDRTLINAYPISEYSDKHFSLNRGNPLYTLFKQKNIEDVDDDTNPLIDIIRETKSKIDQNIAIKFQDIINLITEEAKVLGLQTSDVCAAIDHRDISIKENKVCLHQDQIPLRLNGKGTKRLISLAIQLSIANPNGIILIDEIEQGLEPDRVQHLVNTLRKYTDSQIIFTTHSRDVIVELPCNSIFIKIKGVETLKPIPENLQGCIRKHPEAFFAKRIIVCEGATEVGICRGLNEFRISADKPNISCLGIRLVDGGGSEMIQCAKDFKLLGFDTCLLCDSDREDTNNEKERLKEIEIYIIDCDTSNSIEQQLFKDLDWESIVKLINYRIEIDSHNSKSLFNDTYMRAESRPEYTESWYEKDSEELRKLFGDKSKKSDWYKRIDHGMEISNIILPKITEMNPEKRTRKIFDNLTSWIDK